MMDAGRHSRVSLMTLSEVEEITGYVGNFHVKVRRKARYVDSGKCTACGECVNVCPVLRPDEYQSGLSTRKAIHIPFAQAVPSSYILNMDDCLGNNPIACGKCAEVCEKDCIDFNDQDRIEEFDVGAVVVAIGMDVFDAREVPEYGYGRYQNVIDSMEFERLICAGGPTGGHFVRPSDRSRPVRIGFVQCVGSRSRVHGAEYCSNICCMNTVKDTLLLGEHYPDTESKVFYTDIRAFGKGFEEMYNRSREEGVKYIRGLPGEIEEDPATGNLLVHVENTLTGELEEHEFDLVVLSVGVRPPKDRDRIQKLLTLSKTPSGFLMESHPKLMPVDAPTRGVYIAGCVEAPKDVKESVCQAGTAAARAGNLLSAGEVTIEAYTCRIDAEICNNCGQCAKVCPYHAISFVKGAKTPPTVVEAACAGCGTCGSECRFGAITMRHFTDQQIEAQIDAMLAVDPMDQIFTFACNWCSYAGGDMAGISRLQHPASGRLIRTMCSGRVDESWVLRAFRKGAPMVLLSGCHFADCHYIDANRQTVKRVLRLWDKLEKLGIRPERLQLEWISAAEGQKFAKVFQVLEEHRLRVTKEEIEQTVKVLEEEHLKKLAREAKQAAKRAEKTAEATA